MTAGVTRSWGVFAWAAWGAIVIGVVAYAVLVSINRGAVLHVYGFIGGIPFDGLVFGSVGALVAARLPRNPIGWMFLASGALMVAVSDAQLYAIKALIVQPGSLPVAPLIGWIGSWLYMPAVLLLTCFLPLLFPDGRPPGRFWRWYLLLAALISIAMTLALASITIPGPGARLENSGQYIPSVSWLRWVYILGPLLAVGSIVSLASRMRHASAELREQLRWFLLGGAVTLLGAIASAIGNATGGRDPSRALTYDVGAAIFIASIAALPVGAGIAILRYHLYDIDVVISRAIVYGALALGISGLYAAIVIGIGSLVGSAGGSNLLLSIVATAVVALAFQPFRTRLQRVANRLVYGKRATPYDVLSSFTEAVGERYAEEDLLAHMARLLGEATDAGAVTVWIRLGPDLRPAVTWPAVTPAPASVTITGQLLPLMPGALSVPVRHRGEVLGAITVDKRQGEPLTPIESKLVEDLARQAGLVLRTAGLTESLKQRLEELHASRQRLVTAQDQERRRLERNLHDGAQQNLVALKVKLGLLRTLARKDPEKAVTLADELSGDADDALEALRDLARGIYPPLLADRGLGAALEAQARKASLPVAIDTDGLGRYPQEVEAAVYFCVLEALQNVQKYAAAHSAKVHLRVAGDELTWEVLDDGGGFEMERAQMGSGLQNMHDRLDALGGTLVIQSRPGVGTAVRGTLPIPVRQA